MVGITPRCSGALSGPQHASPRRSPSVLGDDVDLPAGELRGQARVLALLADRERELVARDHGPGLLAAGDNISVCLDPSLGEGLGRALRSVGVAVTTASDEDWYASLGASRVRLVGGNPSRAADEADGDPDLALWANEVTSAPQVELLPFLREQSSR